MTETISPPELIERRKQLPDAVFLSLLATAILLGSVLLIADLDRMIVGGVAMLLLILVMALGLPVGISMLAAASLGLYSLGGYRLAASTAATLSYDAVAQWSLNVIALFVLMGVMMWKGGVTGRAYAVARRLLWWLPGGLAVSSTGAGAVLAASSGSTIGITLAVGRAAIPEMLAAGYNRSMATGSVAMAGTLGQMIPPSLLLVIYAGLATVPVGPQLLAGILPGILLALGFALTTIAWALLRPADAPRTRPAGDLSATALLKLVSGLGPIFVIVLIVIGGIYSGVVTASEAAALGVLAAGLFGWWELGRGQRGLGASFAYLRSCVRDTVVSVAGIFIIVVGAYFLSRMLTLSGLTQAFSEWLVGLGLGRVQLLFVLVVFYLVLGMFLESLPMMMLTVPIFIEPLMAIGVNPLWFGVFLVLMCEIAMVTPPVGILTFVMHRLAQNPEVNLGQTISLQDVFKGVLPYIVVAFAVAALLISWPEIVTLLAGDRT